MWIHAESIVLTYNSSFSFPHTLQTLYYLTLTLELKFLFFGASRPFLQQKVTELIIRVAKAKSTILQSNSFK